MCCQGLSRLDFAVNDDTVNRCKNIGVVEVRLRVLLVGLGRIERRSGHLELGRQRHPSESDLIHFRVRDEVGVFGFQRFGSGLVVLCLLQQRGSPRDVCLARLHQRLVAQQCRLVDPWIDLGQQVAFLDFLIELGQCHTIVDRPRDKRADLNRHHRLYRARRVDDRHDRTPYDLIFAPTNLMAAPPPFTHRANRSHPDTDDGQNNQPYHDPCFHGRCCPSAGESLR